MSIVGSNILAGAAGQGGGYVIEESLRFNSSQSSYLNRTPATTSNRTTWTWSGWVKRGALGVNQMVFQANAASGTTDNNRFLMYFTSGDKLSIDGALRVFRTTSAVFRDPSAWYHIVLTVDTNNATTDNRMLLYVNGVLQSLSTNYALTSGQLLAVNDTLPHYFSYLSGSNFFLDGYLTEVNFIDGQALTSSDFGEYNATTGVWQPVGYTGTYGTNGFYLPMKLDNTTEGFNTVTWVGNDSINKISGVGFSPDLVWLKTRNIARDNYLYDSVRGTTVSLTSNNTAADLASGGEFDSFDTDGFTVKFNAGLGRTNYAGREYVAWCWDAGDTTVSNTDGSITSSVRSNPAYGFSVVTYTGNGTGGATVGHLLGTAPKMVITKNRSASANWLVYHETLGATKYLGLNQTISAQTNIVAWNNTAPTNNVFSIGADSSVNGSGNSMVAYCFSEIAGYSKFGSYTGNGSTTGPVIAMGFKPAFVMYKRIDSAGNWNIVDGTRSAVNPVNTLLRANLSNADETNTVYNQDFTATGWEIKSTNVDINASGATYIYMAFKDTREYAFWLDDSGNNNDWQPNGGITTGSTVTDTPTPYADGGNYAVLNPLSATNISASDANLKITGGGTYERAPAATIGMTAGKYYWEITQLVTDGSSQGIGIATTGYNPLNSLGSDAFGWQFVTRSNASFNGKILHNNSYGATDYGDVTTNDVVMMAFDADTKEWWVGKNGAWFNSGDPAAGTGEVLTLTGSTFFPAVSLYSTASFAANFGQRPFAYTPPTGFKSLHTGNLLDVAIENGSEYFNPVLYQGNNGASLAVTGAGFQPDLVWIKNRSTSNNHNLVDSVRGVNLTLFSNTTDDEDTSTERVTSIDADGFTVGTNNGVNANDTYVSWLWKAGGAAVTNTAGSITSQVSASPTAGFSVVTYTGNGTSGATVGHSLGVAPAMFIIKRRTAANSWIVYHQSSGATKMILLDSTVAESTTIAPFNNTAPTSSVFSIDGLNGYSPVNASANDYVAYCFSEVPGYSSFGSYVGNGSADGPFVYLGFRPAFVMVKQSNASGRNWSIWDGKRDTSNVVTNRLLPNTTNADVVADDLDFLSNGFKIKRTGGDFNASGGTYIYMAFAENPFKNSLAR
jgi:hypothetical protein